VIKFIIHNMGICCLVLWWMLGENGLAQTRFAWPVTPFDQSHMITGNFAEYRSTTNPAHFHNGTDIPKADGSPVYPVKDGIVTSIGTTGQFGSNAFLRVEDVAYVHIAPNPGLSIGDSVFTSQTVLGTILSGLGHVHFTNGFVGSEKNSLLQNSGFTPYDDPWPPIIRFIQFYQNNTDSKFTTNELSGLVDIVAKVDEQNGPPTFSTSLLNNGTYRIGYKIFNTDTSTVVFEPPNAGLRFSFDTKPSNSFVDIVYFRPLSSTTSHAYQVTNDVSRDNFWNTAAFPEDDYIVMVFTEDTQGNTDTAYAAVRTTEADLVAPEQPRLRITAGTETGMEIGWFANTDADLQGYRLFFSFDNEAWSLFRNESVFTAAVTDTFLAQVLNRDVYFRLTAVDDAPVPNESQASDVYGLSNGAYLGKVLLVDGFDRTDGDWTQPNHSFGFTYGQAIVANQFSFDTVPNEAVAEGLADLQQYQAVFWFVGDESFVDETFDAVEQARLVSYLEQGGNLFISGSNIAWDLDQDSGSDSATVADESFLHDYFKSDYVADAAQSSQVVGAGGSLFEGLQFEFGQRDYAVTSADVIAPVGQGVLPALLYDDSDVAALQFAGEFSQGSVPGKLIFLAFPFETIADQAVREELMQRVLTFFSPVTSVSSDKGAGVIPDKFALQPNYPNPFNPSTTLRIDLPSAARVEVTVYNMLGQRIRRLVRSPVAQGSHEVSWDGQDDHGRIVPSGIYLVNFVAEDNKAGASFSQTRKVALVK